MRSLLVVVLVFALAGCGERAKPLVVIPSADRLDWAAQLGRANAVSDPALVRRVEDAASASGARALDVVVLAQGPQHVPVVTLDSSDPASYMKHHLRGFLQRIGYFDADARAFVELVDDRGRFAWSAGRFRNGGMVHPRPDLDECSPIVHSQLVGAEPPPCPAD
jgi:hypothetical protein